MGQLHSRRAWWVIDWFEKELCDYTGAPFACAVDSCTNALFLSLLWWKHFGDFQPDKVCIPRFTYPGVLHSIKNVGYRIDFVNSRTWQEDGLFYLNPFPIIDSARSIYRGCYHPHTIQCLSFHAAKQLPSGGGAILTDKEEVYNWIQQVKNDGRVPGSYGGNDIIRQGWHMGMTPPDAARGLWMLSRYPDKPAPLPYEPNYPDLSLL